MSKGLEGRGIAAPLTKLIIFASITLMLTGLLAETLGSMSFKPGTIYRAQFTDVTGLLTGDDIRVAGVKVGQVTGIKLVKNKIAEVSFKVDNQVPVATTVQAKIRYRNLVGQRYIALSEAPGSGKRLRPGGLIPLSQTVPSLDLTVLFNGFRPLFTALTPTDVNKLAYEIIQVLQGEGGTMASLLQHTASLTNTLADRDAVIGRVITNLNSVLATLSQRDSNLDQTISQLQQFVSGLAADRTAIGNALANLGDLTGSTASLLTDARAPLASDVGNLGKLATTLNQNASVLDDTLHRLPNRYDTLVRTASYGSWFNFYLCDFDGTVSLPGAGDVNPATFSAPGARCSGSGGSR